MDVSPRSTWKIAAVFTVLLCATAAHAIPLRNQRVATNNVRRAAPPVTRVALQLSELAIGDGITMRAMLHAIARDSWPSLVACVQTPRPRGVVSVTFHVHGRSVVVDRITGAPVARDAVLRRCVLDATQRTHAPAHTGEDINGAFDLSFDLPALR